MLGSENPLVMAQPFHSTPFCHTNAVDKLLSKSGWAEESIAVAKVLGGWKSNIRQGGCTQVRTVAHHATASSSRGHACCTAAAGWALPYKERLGARWAPARQLRLSSVQP